MILQTYTESLYRKHVQKCTLPYVTFLRIQQVTVLRGQDTNLIQNAEGWLINYFVIDYIML
jgi:hypothetical protein